MAAKRPAAASPGTAAALTSLRRRASAKTLAGLARYGIPSEHALGVAMRDIQALAKTLGKDHALAAQLWESGCYEARLLAAYVDEPAQVTRTQLDRWCADFDNWAVCDTVCFALFDRSPHAWGRLAPWARSRGEFQKRAAFALLWGLSVHDPAADDAAFLRGLDLVERAAGDERLYVKKAVSMALRATGKRNRVLHGAALALAGRLAEAQDATSRWIGKDALRDLAKPAVARRLARVSG